MNLEEILIKILLIVVIAIASVVIGLLYKGIDRKLAARMQARIGPPVVQPFWDVGKLMIKENIVPKNAVAWLFNFVPLLTLAVTISILFYLPFGSIEPVLSGHGDLILILYLLTIPALGMVIGGFSSGSPYATVGAQREMVTMMSYEFPLAIAIIAIAWKLNTFSLLAISSTPVWSVVGPPGFLGFLLIALVLLAVMPAELSRIPFDAPEAETEIAEGVLAEYSGRNLAMFYLADAVKTIVVASLFVAIFLPYNISSLVALNIIFFLIKIFAVIFVAVTLIRIGAARLKIDQITYVYWFPLTAIGFIGLALIWLETIL
ncbi:MAG: formate hydrogenlyase subunit 4 [Candidatus Altiarchaeales archaeon HGW-Altiarchaeales-3]|nr:MAG: formate hydrogenlyase subunit 4 [Candidatus Altiarchaeales archaeon HGW-Altiarchaeales-3]